MAKQDLTRIGDWQLDRQLNQLSRDGESHTIEPLAVEVLAYLAARPGEVVSTDELAESLWNRRFVGDSPVYRIIAELRRLLGDDARSPEYIETIRKRGYRLVAPVEVIGADRPGGQAGEQPEDGALVARADAGPGAGTEAVMGASRRSRQLLTAASLGAIAVAAVAIWQVWLVPDRALDREPAAADPAADSLTAPASIAVLPFTDMSADGGNEHLGDGIADVLIHQLAQIPDLKVIARNSSFTFKGRNTDVREIGGALGVEAVLEGSVQRSENRLRITAQLVDTGTGVHFWSRIFNREEADIFAIQDEIALAVVDELERIGVRDELPLTSEHPVSFRAYDLYLLGRARLASFQPELAIEFFEDALEREPDFALAEAGLGEAYVRTAGSRWAGGEADPGTLERARRALDRALALDPGLVDAQTPRILLAMYEQDWEAVDAAFAAATARAPGNVSAYHFYANALRYRAFTEIDGAYRERSEAVLRQARALDPLNQEIGVTLAQSLLSTSESDEAIAILIELYDRSQSLFESLAPIGTLGYAYVSAGLLDKAIALVRLNPDPSIWEEDPRGSELAAEIYEKLNQYDEARGWFRFMPQPDVAGYTNRVFVEWLDGNADVALAMVDELMTRAGTDPAIPVAEADLLRLVMLAMTESCDEVLEYADVVDSTPLWEAQPVENVALALCYRERGADDRAAAVLQPAIQTADLWLNRLGLRDSNTLTLAAEVYAAARQRDEAIRLLWAAYDSGFRHHDRLTRSPAFRWLLDDPETQALLDRLLDDRAAMLARIAEAEASGDWFTLAGIEPKPWMIAGGAATAQ